MPLKVLLCNCSGVESQARNVLRDGGCPNWMAYEIHKGKEHCQTVLSRLPDQLHSLLAFRALEDFLEQNSTFAIVAGYDANSFFWQDVHRNAPKDVWDAQAIVKQFA